MQIDVHIPPAVPVVIVVESGDHVWQMTGLVVVVVGGAGFWVQNAAEANEGKKAEGCGGASRPPRRSRHCRHSKSPPSGIVEFPPQSR